MTSWPRAIEILRIAAAILSTAMSRKPSAISSRLLPPTASAISCSRARDASGSSGWSPSGPNTAGKCVRVDPAEEQVAVGDGQRPAVAIAGRARVRAGALRPDAEAHAVEAADRPAARRDGMDLHHRRADAHARRRRSRRQARTARHNATRRSRCRPCRSRSAARRRAARSPRPFRPLRRPGRTGSRPCRETRSLRRGRRSTA